MPSCVKLSHQVRLAFVMRRATQDFWTSRRVSSQMFYVLSWRPFAVGCRCWLLVLCSCQICHNTYMNCQPKCVRNISFLMRSLCPAAVKPGDRIAQLILERIMTPEVEEADEDFDATTRGSNGFGSTGFSAKKRELPF